MTYDIYSRVVTRGKSVKRVEVVDRQKMKRRVFVMWFYIYYTNWEEFFR